MTLIKTGDKVRRGVAIMGKVADAVDTGDLNSKRS
jgi:hypothetical protein